MSKLKRIDREAAEALLYMGVNVWVDSDGYFKVCRCLGVTDREDVVRDEHGHRLYEAVWCPLRSADCAWDTSGGEKGGEVHITHEDGLRGIKLFYIEEQE